jgi:hypothetical protein
LWEILTGVVPFHDVRRQEEIRKNVCFSFFEVFYSFSMVF